MIQIEWGSVGRSEALEADIHERAEKLFAMAPQATKFVANFQITNPVQSQGVAAQRVHLELRLPMGRDLHAHAEGSDLYRCVREAASALSVQLDRLKGKLDRHAGVRYSVALDEEAISSFEP